jgi:lipoate-protein ligase A
MTTLKALLGEAPSVEEVHKAVLSGLGDGLNIAIEPGAITAQEEALAAELGREFIETDAFVFESDAATSADILTGVHRAPGGAISAHVRLEGAGQAERIREVLFTGDFFVTPARAVLDLEAALRGTRLERLPDAIDAYFSSAEIGLATITAEDVKAAVRSAIAARDEQGSSP